MADQYKVVPLNSSMKYWNTHWLYIENAEDSLSTDIDTMARSHVNWTVRPSSKEMHQVEELLDILARTDVNGVGVTVNFIARRIQPCKERGATPHTSFTMRTSPGRRRRG